MNYSVPYEWKTDGTQTAKSITVTSDLGAGRVGHLITNSDEKVFSPPLRRITNLDTSSGNISIVEASTGNTIVLPNVPAGGSIDHDITQINNTGTTVNTGLIFAQQ